MIGAGISEMEQAELATPSWSSEKTNCPWCKIHQDESMRKT